MGRRLSLAIPGRYDSAARRRGTTDTRFGRVAGDLSHFISAKGTVALIPLETTDVVEEYLISDARMLVIYYRLFSKDRFLHR
jgi:hypothetical protein